jgi:hypothetical protein
MRNSRVIIRILRVKDEMIRKVLVHEEREEEGLVPNDLYRRILRYRYRKGVVKNGSRDNNKSYY